jgi:hypothetical protein
VVVRITADFSIGHATANLSAYQPGTAPAPAVAAEPSPPATIPVSATLPPSTTVASP